MFYRLLSSIFIYFTCLLAVEPQGERLRLAPLVEEALRRNPQIVAAQKRYEAAKQRPDIAGSLPDPMLSGGYTSSGSPRPVAGLGQEPIANVGVMFSQQFPFPGKRKLRADIAATEAAVEFEQYQLAQQDVLARLRRAFYQLHYTYKVLEVLTRNRDLLDRFRETTEARYSVGKAAQQDVFRAQTQLSLIETRVLRLDQERRSREAEINSLLNRPVRTVLPPPEDLTVAALDVTLNRFYEFARANAPAIQRDQKMVERSQLAVNLARKGYYPDYTLSGGYYNMGRMPDMYEFRVDVDLPLYFWRKQRKEVAEQSAMASEARHTLQSTANDLEYRIRDDYQMAQTSRRLMDVYRKTVLPQANLTLESSLPSYETGAVDFLTLLMNLDSILETEMNYQEEFLNYHLALIRLQEMTGMKLLED
ncbi:MAG: TolC family protein [Bryobacteraceae bacterium]|nr:TolC family protein [Bryobacteraceae bacterium]